MQLRKHPSVKDPKTVTSGKPVFQFQKANRTVRIPCFGEAFWSAFSMGAVELPKGRWAFWILVLPICRRSVAQYPCCCHEDLGGKDVVGSQLLQTYSYGSRTRAYGRSAFLRSFLHDLTHPCRSMSSGLGLRPWCSCPLKLTKPNSSVVFQKLKDIASLAHH
jgi:hypothetical protein